jgi:branched-chain amino acid transport system ATP-binding protein
VSEPDLEVRDLVAGYVPDIDILRGVSIAVHPGEIVTVLGPNGAGKSTMIKAIAGLVPVRSGSILQHGRDITGRATHTMVGSGLAYVPQVGNVFSRMSGRTSGSLAVLPRRPLSLGASIRSPCCSPTWPVCATSLPVNCPVANVRWWQSVALMAGPRVLMLDEPSAGLSPKLVQSCFSSCWKSGSASSILMVEQNARAAWRFPTRGHVLAEGQGTLRRPGGGAAGEPGSGALYLGAGSRLAP